MNELIARWQSTAEMLRRFGAPEHATVLETALIPLDATRYFWIGGDGSTRVYTRSRPANGPRQAALVPGIPNVNALRRGGRAAAQAGRAVIGHYPGYLRLADELGTRRFNIPERVCGDVRRGEVGSEPALIGSHDLRGDEVLLSLNRADIRPGVASSLMMRLGMI
jgi:hypothetical protein